MALTRLTKDMAVISKLPDDPNDSGGLTAAALKDKFDEGGKALKSYLNDTLLPELEGLGVEAGVTSASPDTLRAIRLGEDGAIEVSPDGESWRVTSSSGHIITDGAGQTLPQRTRLKFLHSEVTDDGESTVVRGIPGPKGEQGVQGPRGLQGKAGPVLVPEVNESGFLSWTVRESPTLPPPVSIRGPQGVQGTQGIQGIQGPAGIQGPPGVQGPTGPQGPAGQNGMDGNSFSVLGLYESAAALTEAHPAGQAGEAFAVGSSLENTIYIWDRDKGTWRDIGPLQGPMGPQGPAGEQGAQGIQGIQGPAGVQGVQGEQGIQGIPGPAGAPAVINGVNTLTLIAGEGILLDQQENLLTIRGTGSGGSGLPVVDAHAGDLDLILTGGAHSGVYLTGEHTIGTPYHAGVTDGKSAEVLSYGTGEGSGLQVAFVAGKSAPFLRTLTDSVIGEWKADFNAFSVIPVENGGTGHSTADTTPTENSTKMVTSGGVYEAIANHKPTLAELGLTATDTDLEAGVTPLATGNICLVYE